jgi:hypothetical protein
MMKTRTIEGGTSKKIVLVGLVALVGALAGLPGVALAADPVVKTVPWAATNPLIPHDILSGRMTMLKGTADVQGATIQYTWDFGDGSPVATGAVTDRYAIQASHTYTGATGTIFTARLTVQNTSTGETGNAAYYVEIRDKTLDVEANIAIDEGLWYLHKSQSRSSSGGVDYGDWTAVLYGGYARSVYYGATCVNINAFEVNGHLESGSPSNPYVETVARGMKRIFTWLTTMAIGNQTNGLGTFNPDTNGNGYGVRVNQSYPYYQGGMFMDTIVASGTPAAVATTGAAGILGRTYADIVQDMVDTYAYCQYDGAQGGGWRYNCNEFPDNSACQWGAIGLLAAERVWGLTVPSWVKDWNIVWLAYTQNAAGYFGYTSSAPAWGPYATTPSGMVQMAMDGIGRGAAGWPSWDAAETFMRNNFCNCCGYGAAVKDYYYGLFSFVKALLLHDSDGDGVAEPIKFLQSSTPGVVPIDWYAAEASTGAPCDGVARTLVNDQALPTAAYGGGWWSGHNASGEQFPFETAQAIIMLNRTVFESGNPVAVAQAIPNPGVGGQMITLDGSGSFHQDPAKTIDSWEWDLDNDGTYDVSGPVVATSFAAVGDYIVRLRVTDDAAPEKTAETTVTVRITTPPIAPTADAGGPYVFCPQSQPWFLDGSGSVNPDEGESEPGQPGDTIQQYAWDLDGDGAFDDAIGAIPDVTAFLTALGPGSYLIQLRVTDTTAASFPSSGLGDLSDTDSAQIFVKEPGDSACACVDDLTARPKSGKVQLVWTHTGAHHYNVYRGTISGGPYVKIASTTSTYSTYLDTAVVNGTTYYYVVRPAAANDAESCQSNQASATPSARLR